MSNFVRPHGLQPTRLLCPWDSPGKNTGVGGHFLLQCMKVESESEVTQSCPTLSDPMDCSLPGSFVHEIVQATVLEWGAIAFSNNIYCTVLFEGINEITLKKKKKPILIPVTRKCSSNSSHLLIIIIFIIIIIIFIVTQTPCETE